MSTNDMLAELRRLQGTRANLLRLVRFVAPPRQQELEAEAERLQQQRVRLQAELEAKGIYQF